ncbi:MAG: hypothetical protein N5P05_000727 [Chroococcopsis gigantea SAG 12.99]|jgi:hypothetical protein|nr:hypothetical protein [Chlorogloea purpurea SAG 13.99]MDV2999121.1 hypothetical protein [Chroococcopsis gigantea SAG 12.99]
MDAFSLSPPQWTENSVHSTGFHCPHCGLNPAKAKAAWLNRRAPVTGNDGRRKWQEFYLCECDKAWWAWSDDRPPTNLRKIEE